MSRRKSGFAEKFEIQPMELLVEDNTVSVVKVDIEEEVRRLAEICEEFELSEEAENYLNELNSGKISAYSVMAIAQMYFDGAAVEQNEAKACWLFEKAYEMGARRFRPGDLLMMGTYRQYGLDDGRRYGLNRDLNLAVKWYEMSAELVTSSYAHLGEAYLEHEIRDYKKAYEYFCKTEKDNIRANYYLGVMHEFGLCGKADPSKAMNYYNKVVQLYHEKGCKEESLCEQAVERIKELRGDAEASFTKEFFETMHDTGRMW